MSISVQGSLNSQDFELNLASIIDCFTVLIAFMLASASFLSIGILDAGAAAGGTTATSETPPEIQVTVELTAERSFSVKVTGKTKNTSQNTNLISAAQGAQWDYSALNDTLRGLRSKYPNLKAITLAAQDSVEYQEIVKAMNAVRETLPYVLLGGF